MIADTSRRTQHAFAFMALLPLALSGCEGKAAPTAAPPNIIFVLADDLGYGELGIYGQTKIATPQLDRMAMSGMRFTDGYAGAPVCTPSRMSLMTGRHVGNLSGNSNIGLSLGSDQMTIGEIMRQAGYTTAAIGKWGIGRHGAGNLPHERGFDYWFGPAEVAEEHRQFPPHLWRNGKKVPLPANANGGRGTYSNDVYTEEALSFVRRNRHAPFFLYLAYTAPHADLDVPADSLSAYAGRFDEKPYAGAANASRFARVYPAPVAQPNATHAAMISRLDRDVGQLLAVLRELGLADNTLVIFTSDNGPHAEGGADPAYFDSAGPFRGAKRDLYEGGIRVPMIAWWPGRVASGRVERTPVAFWDFLPTFADLARALPPPNDGTSLVPLLLDTQGLAPRDLYWESGESLETPPLLRQAIRRGPLKGLRIGMDSKVKVFDLQGDLHEDHDVGSKHAAERTAFERIFDDYAAKRAGKR